MNKLKKTAFLSILKELLSWVFSSRNSAAGGTCADGRVSGLAAVKRVVQISELFDILIL